MSGHFSWVLKDSDALPFPSSVRVKTSPWRRAKDAFHAFLVSFGVGTKASPAKPEAHSNIRI